MDRRERVFAAMDKKPVDRVPVGFWYHFGGGDSFPADICEKHVEYVKDCNLDMIKVMCDGYFPYPFEKKPKTPEEFRALQPLGAHHPFIEGQVERAKRIMDLAGKDYPVFYNVFAPFSSLRFGAGDGEVMAALGEDPLSVMQALDTVGYDNATLTERLIREAGVDGVYYCVQGGEKDRFTEEQYRTFIRPSDLYVLERAQRYSDYNILHCCGWAGDGNRMELWKDYPVKAVNWAVFVEKMSLAEGREFFGNKCCVGGYESLHRSGGLMNTGVIHEGTKEEIQAFTRKTIADFGKTGLILGADCTIDNRIDHEHIRWVVEAADTL